MEAKFAIGMMDNELVSAVALALHLSSRYPTLQLVAMYSESVQQHSVRLLSERVSSE